MSKRKPTNKLPPFVALTWDMLNHRAYINLSPSAAKILPYFLGKIQRIPFKDPARYSTAFAFRCSEAETLGFNRRTFWRALDELIPEAAFGSFSYPIIGPSSAIKRRTGRCYRCCRGGGQRFNVGRIDLNLLSAYFLEKSRDNPSLVKEVIDGNRLGRGWLIFATHDISKTPTPYGCTPSFFEDIVKYSLDSGATILPVAKALDAILQGGEDSAAREKHAG